MLFVSVEDFFARSKGIPRLSWEEEKALAQRMAQGDEAAREALLRSYLPLVAAYVRRAPRELRTLRTVYVCITAVEKRMDRFHFQQDSERFAHHLGWTLRQCITRCIADRY